MKGENNHRFGVRASPETRRKLSQALVGKNRGKGHPSAHKGKSRPEFSQEKHWNWQGGKTSENKTLRVSVQYRNWREAVFDRDDYTCQGCGERGVELNADHIKPFAYFPECRLQIDNGRTLCVPCHKTTDTYAGRAKKYAKTL